MVVQPALLRSLGREVRRLGAPRDVGPVAGVDRDAVAVVVLPATEEGAVGGGSAIRRQLGEECLSARLTRRWPAGPAAEAALERLDEWEVGGAGAADDVRAARAVHCD